MLNELEQIQYQSWKAGILSEGNLLLLIQARRYAREFEQHEVIYIDGMIESALISMQTQDIESEYWDMISRELKK